MSPFGMIESLETLRRREGDVIANPSNPEQRLTLLGRAKGGWYVRQMNGRRARWSYSELNGFEKVQS